MTPTFFLEEYAFGDNDRRSDSMGAQAVDTFAVKDTISLSFDGTTAICSATCKGSNTDDKVKATLTLVSEGKTVASWSASDSYSVSINAPAEIRSALTLTTMPAVAT